MDVVGEEEGEAEVRFLPLCLEELGGWCMKGRASGSSRMTTFIDLTGQHVNSAGPT